jgi:hypothetical protein
MDAIKHFKVLEGMQLKVGLGCVVCLASQQMPLTQSVEIVPVGLL